MQFDRTLFDEQKKEHMLRVEHILGSFEEEAEKKHTHRRLDKTKYELILA